MRGILLLCVLLLLQVVRGQKELAGAYIEGHDLCPEAAKRPVAPPPAPQRSSSTLGRLFAPSPPRAPAPAPVAACTPERLCGPVQIVLQRCKNTPGCRAVSYDGRCGVLKTSPQPRRNKRGWSTFVMA